jgi:hypothetical protein
LIEKFHNYKSSVDVLHRKVNLDLWHLPYDQSSGSF